MLLIDILVLLFTYLFSFVYFLFSLPSFRPSFLRSFVHSFTHSLTHSLNWKKRIELNPIQSKPIHSFNHSFYSIIHSITHSFFPFNSFHFTSIHFISSFHFMIFICSLTHSVFLPSFFHFQFVLILFSFHFMWFSCVFSDAFFTFDHCFGILYCSSLCTLGSVYFCYVIHLFLDHKIFSFLIHVCFLLIPHPFMEYCSSLCTFGSVYCFWFIFVLDPLKYTFLLIHFCFFVDASPTLTCVKKHKTQQLAGVTLVVARFQREVSSEFLFFDRRTHNSSSRFMAIDQLISPHQHIGSTSDLLWSLYLSCLQLQWLLFINMLDCKVILEFCSNPFDVPWPVPRILRGQLHQPNEAVRGQGVTTLNYSATQVCGFSPFFRKETLDVLFWEDLKSL